MANLWWNKGGWKRERRDEIQKYMVPIVSNGHLPTVENTSLYEKCFKRCRLQNAFTSDKVMPKLSFLFFFQMLMWGFEAILLPSLSL